MSKLTKEQSAFLAKHNTPISSVFDASGMGKSDYRAAMKELGKTVAIGVTPCKKATTRCARVPGIVFNAIRRALPFKSDT